jgi:hypothetical protein
LGVVAPTLDQVVKVQRHQRNNELYHRVARALRELLADSALGTTWNAGMPIAGESDLAAAGKDYCAKQKRIKGYGDAVHRAAASEWFKHTVLRAKGSV